jgi:hypothetical protein
MICVVGFATSRRAASFPPRVKKEYSSLRRA